LRLDYTTRRLLECRVRSNAGLDATGRLQFLSWTAGAASQFAFSASEQTCVEDR
jgi:hypothetical protein